MVEYSFSVEHLEYYLTILVRVSTFFFTAPFFGMSNVPRKVKVGLSMVVAMVLYSALPGEILQYDTALGYATVIVKEAAIGLILGLVTNICTSILNFAGRVIDMEIGLSMASMFDPLTKQDATVTGQIYNFLVLLLLVIMNFHHYLIRAFADTYTLIPINYENLHFDTIYKVFIQFMIDCFVVGFRIVLPVFCTTLVINVVLGILAKVAPQMNMFAVGMQIKILAGFCVLFVVLQLLPDVADFIYVEMKTMMVAAIEAMR